MRNALIAVVVVQLVLVAGILAAVGSGLIPLGVPGEWEWLRLPRSVAPSPSGWALAFVAVVALAVFAAAGRRALVRKPATPAREAAWVVALFVVSVLTQVLMPNAAPDAYDLVRWANVPFDSGSSGYYQVARRKIHDPWRFLADYPAWIRRQDSLHIGTHPPGLFLVEYGLLRFTTTHPQTARGIIDAMPWPVQEALTFLGRFYSLPIADRAAVALTAVLTVLACAATVVPLYLLARATLPAPAAWTAAVLWPLVPSTLMFQPVADTAFPLLSVAALALAAHAPLRRAGSLVAGAAGVILAVGMLFTLAFLPVGLVVGIVLMWPLGIHWRRRVLLVAATGAGFLGTVLLAWWVSRANPFVIWWWNLQNHARFYVEFPRSYRAWVFVNMVEFAAGLGLPVVVWVLLGFSTRNTTSRAAWAALAVLIVLNFSGKNLSEVGRLWLPFMPPLLIAAAEGMTRLGAGGKTLAATLVLLGIQTVGLESMIQVVYPIVPGAALAPRPLQEDVRDADPQLRVDLDQFAARDEPAAGGQLHRGAAVTTQFHDVARLEVRQTAQREIHSAQFHNERDGDLPHGNAAHAGAGCRFGRGTHGDGLPRLEFSLQGGGQGQTASS